MFIRYYKGKYKLLKIEKNGVAIIGANKTALYRALEDAPNWKSGDLVIAPYRICWKHEKEEQL